MFQAEVLILKVSSGSISTGQISSVTQQVGDDTLEAGALVAEALLSGAEGTEVLRSLRDDVIAELNDDLPHWVSIGGHVEVNSCFCHCFSHYFYNNFIVGGQFFIILYLII